VDFALEFWSSGVVQVCFRTATQIDQGRFALTAVVTPVQSLAQTGAADADTQSTHFGG
jgi:hypothetical protein